jgi:hypothetical protein
VDEENIEVGTGAVVVLDLSLLGVDFEQILGENQVNS